MLVHLNIQCSTDALASLHTSLNHTVASCLSICTFKCACPFYVVSNLVRTKAVHENGHLVRTRSCTRQMHERYVVHTLCASYVLRKVPCALLVPILFGSFFSVTYSNCKRRKHVACRVIA